MKVVSFTEARQNFARTLDAVIDDAEETVIHRSGHEPVVIISLAEWNSIKETEYLLSNPANAARLREALAQAERGDLVEHGLDDLDEAGADTRESA
ncbi:type II toxin-antitoxin system Phd/YefM family antitoxin [Actinoplanes sp. RD1]|uniref:type II toxin-antitoxin system Phd/YefM family antitoxin n=1 Tax=Actinoplanes sp. RD1 TaxID=3064538 RepID=UPI002741EF1C|nr:type II toxin-antitoxin system prevent-host-death family antitoxin [Actinoplanes sp. RD1]